MLDADASLCPRSVSVISETMGGETMVIDTESGVFYSLRGVASAMWLAVEAGVTRRTSRLRSGRSFRKPRLPTRTSQRFSTHLRRTAW